MQTVQIRDAKASFSALAPGRKAFVPAHLAGQISDAAIAKGCHPSFADVANAALAQHAWLLLLACNLKHFATGRGLYCPADQLAGLRKK